MKNIVNLGNVATYINGYAFKPSDWAEDGTPIIRIQDLTGNSYQMNRFKGIVDSKYDVNSGDVLISWSASLGVYVWNRGNAVLNQHIFKVVFDKEEVDKDFFVFQIDNLLKRAANQAHGATMRHLTKPVFDALPFYLPDIKTQRLISSKLNLIVHLIEDHHEQLKKLDELIRSRFLEMFGNKEYSICQLSDQCEIITKGTTPTTIGYNFTTDGVRFIKIEDITEEGKFDTAKMMHISDECNMIMKRSQLKSGDLLFSIAGAIGRCAVVTNDILPANINQALAIIRLRKDAQLSRNFLFAVLKSSYVEKQYKGLRRGGAQLNLSLKDIGNFKILLPPESEQENFIDLYKQVDKSKMAVQKSLDELEILKKSLMQTYFG